jgi:hypothetical protein
MTMRQYWVLTLVLLASVSLIATPGWGVVQAGVVKVARGAAITFPRPFSTTPIVVCSGQTGSRAMIMDATDTTRTGFHVQIIDTYGNWATGTVWVQWVAATAESGVQCGERSIHFGDKLTFRTPFPSTPTIVTSAMAGSNPVMVSAINNSPTGCNFWFAEHYGSPPLLADVSWIAIVPRSSWRCGVTKHSDGSHLSFPALPATPVIITSGNCGGAITTAAVNNTVSGATLSLRKHDNTAAQNAWVQWWALPAGIASNQIPLVMPH